MKQTNLLNLLALGLVLTFTGTGCKHPQRTTPIPNLGSDRHDPRLDEQSQAVPFAPQPGPGDTSNNNPFDSSKNHQHSPNDQGNHSGWNESRDLLKDKSVYFDFDRSTIRSSEQSKMEEVASYLKSNPEVAVKVEGNCDERGTEEYNRSLGERRALAAREYLIHSGIAAERVDTLSNGQDKPAELGHNESAFSKNRRDDFIILTSPKIQ